MPASNCKPNLSTQVLSILQNHGAVTIDMLHRLTEPPTEKKNLRQSLGLMRKKGLIESVTLNSQTTFYQICQARPAIKKVAEKLNVADSNVVQPLLRKQDWMHNQWCEYWSQAVRKMFPEAEIIREHSVNEHKLAKSVLKPVGKKYAVLLPDFLLILPNGKNAAPTYIAFEIERTRKSDERILRKLKKYANRTSLDGLIYICDSGRLSETIRQLYQIKMEDKSYRIKRYSEHFFLFSDSMSGGGANLNRLFNAKGENVDFNKWCGLLRNTKWTLRRDSHFKL